jgi:DNA-binding response OmpR family regulator
MASVSSINIYTAIRNRDDRSQIEDNLVMDDADVSTFSSARELWERFQVRPARFVITDRRFGSDFDGLELTRQIREHFRMPYVYVLMLSRLAQLKEIHSGLAAGVDDYLIKPHNPFQIRTRVLVGMRWLTYIDSVTGGDKRAGQAAAGS